MNTTRYSEPRPSRPARPVAQYAVDYDGEFYWLVRHGVHTTMRISPYTDDKIAWTAADYLNTLVRWEAPT